MRFRRKSKDYIYVLLIASIFFASFGFFIHRLKIPDVSILEKRFFDFLFELRGPVAPAPEIVILALDEESLYNLRQHPFPLPREVFARLLSKLEAAGARTVFLDFLFSDKSPYAAANDDEIFKAALSRIGRDRVVLASKLERYRVMGADLGHGDRIYNDNYLLKTPIEPFRDKASLGIVNFGLDDDGFLRRFSLVFTHGGKPYPTCILASLFSFLKLAPADFSMASGEEAAIGSHRLPLDADGSCLINFAGPPFTFPIYSLYQALEDKLPAKALDGKLVLVGSMFLDSGDYHFTPFLRSPKYLSSTPMYGVEVIANALSTVLSDSAIRRVEPPALRRFFHVAPVLASALCVLSFPLWPAPLWLLAFCLGPLAASAYCFFSLRLWLPAAGVSLDCVIAIFASLFAKYLLIDREKRRYLDMFSRYVDRAVVGEIMERGLGFPIRGRELSATVLFADIRGFTRYSEKLKPQKVFEEINEIFEELAGVIFKHGGMLDKYIGDCIMAVFGAPVECPDHGRRALECAAEMMRVMQRLNRARVSTGKQALRIGIGINSGLVMAGNVGYRLRLEYTVLGDAVNVASRLLAHAGMDEILVTENALSEMRKAIAGRGELKMEMKKLDELKLKGREGKVDVSAVIWDSHDSC